MYDTRSSTLLSSGDFIIDERYELIKVHTRDAGSISYKADDKKTNKPVLIQKNILSNFESDCYLEILKDIKIKNFFDHENICKLVTIQHNKAPNDEINLFLVTEYFPATLHEIIHSVQNLTNEHIQYIIYQILRGLLVLHSAGILHGHIVPFNILINEECHVNLSSFHLARKENENLREEERNGSGYNSPEKILTSLNFTNKSDIGSCGCILAQLIGRNPLFNLNSKYRLLSQIICCLGSPNEDDLHFLDDDEALNFMLNFGNKPKTPGTNIFTDVNPLALDLLDKMLVFNPNKRGDVEKCLAHPFLCDFHDINDEPISKELFDWSFMIKCIDKEFVVEEIENEANKINSRI